MPVPAPRRRKLHYTRISRPDALVRRPFSECTTLPPSRCIVAGAYMRELQAAASEAGPAPRRYPQGSRTSIFPS